MKESKLIYFTPAAILVPIIRRGSELNLVLTQRSQALKTHSGQISFPGGSQQPSDKNMIETALRETHEEIGVEPHHIEVITTLTPIKTPSRFEVTPVIGKIIHPVAYIRSEQEVEEIFEVPISYLFDPKNVKIQEMDFKDSKIQTHVIQYQGKTIWGFTALVISQLPNIVIPL